MSNLKKTIVLGLLFVLIFFISVLVSSLISSDPLIIKLLSAILPITCYVVYLLKYSPSRLTFQKTLIPKYFLWLIPWISCVSMFVWGPVFIWPEDWGLSYYSYIAAECLMLAVTEELVFRGALFRVFQGTRFPIYVLFSAFLFGLVHYSAGITDHLQTGIIGLGYAVARTSGCPLYILIMCHYGTRCYSGSLSRI